MAKIRIKNLKNEKRKPTRQPSQLSLLNIKVSEEDRKELIKMAKTFAKGNLSAWLRVAGRNYNPFPKIGS